MSVAEHEEDEPDYCEIHGFYEPCWQCRLEAKNEQLEQQLESKREG